MKTNIFLLLHFCCLFIGIKSENILILMGIASPSHHIWTSALANGLAEKSKHNVTVLSPNKDENPPENVHYIYLENIYTDLYPEDISQQKFNLTEMSDLSPFDEIDVFYDFCTAICELIINKNGIKEILNYPNNFKFDMIIVDYTCGPCLIFLAHKFNNPPIVGMSAFLFPPYTVDILGGHNYFAYVPFYNLDFNAFNMTFWQRLYNFMVHIYASWNRSSFLIPSQDKLIRNKFNVDFPYLDDMEKRMVLALVNSDPSFYLPFPLNPNVIPVGGLHIKESKPLAKDIENFLNQSENGAVLFSLGTNVKSDQLGSDAQIKLIEAFAQMPQYNFLWKFETQILPMKLPKNVMIKKWLPQNDLLAHPKIKLFISHCGGLSTMESIWFGVPMVGIPFLGDQHTNSGRAVQAGLAEKINYLTMTTDEIVRKVLLVLETPSYRNKMEIQSKRFRDQKELPLDRALWWIDWVLRNPQSDHIQSPVLQLGFIRANSIDVLAFFLFLIVILLICVIKMFSICLQLKRKIKIE